MLIIFFPNSLRHTSLFNPNWTFKNNFPARINMFQIVLDLLFTQITHVIFVPLEANRSISPLQPNRSGTSISLHPFVQQNHSRYSLHPNRYVLFIIFFNLTSHLCKFVKPNWRETLKLEEERIEDEGKERRKWKTLFLLKMKEMMIERAEGNLIKISPHLCCLFIWF